MTKCAVSFGELIYFLSMKEDYSYQCGVEAWSLPRKYFKCRWLPVVRLCPVSSWRPMNCQRVAKIGHLGRGQFCHTTAMTTKTIPEYLEDERRNRADTELRTEEEAARIQPLQHGHHRTPKPPQPELPAPVEAVAKARKPAVAKARKPVAAKARKPVAAKARKPVAAKARKPVAA